LNMGKKDIAFVQKLIADHMRPSNLTKSGNVTQRAALKFFREIGELTPYQIILSMGDWKSYEKLRCNPQAGPKNQYKTAQKMIEDYFIVKNYKPPKKIIDGNIIMKTFKLKPGPWVGDLLSAVAEKQAQKKINDTKEALNYLKTKLTAIYKKYKLKS
ncbi:MAG: hypothetical protein LBC07_02505, partial [Elusimicrobiota bacterium]|nr:hypothetical protein [Elusimicrobiota bacterium]